ncbi:MAG: tyrosine-type recombinase/integrase [Ancalomicrobiaceae bacterium]|nr:tyrosine-type recombinase/integrase [Ancalomicrobiaceae bacterium]
MTPTYTISKEIADLCRAPPASPCSVSILTAVHTIEGRCQAGLDSVVPAYAHWRLADMPRYLTAEQVNRLIAACDGEATASRRDRAIVLLLARLGLRAGDVAQLRLVDIE